MTYKEQLIEVIEFLQPCRNRRKLKMIAYETGLHYLTIWKLATHKTKQPHPDTLDLLEDYFNGK